MAVSALHKQLLGCELRHKLIHIVRRPLPGKEFAGGYIQKCHSGQMLAGMYGGHEVILTMVKYVIAHRHAGSHQLGDAALHKLFGQLRILELLTYSHSLAGTDKFGKIRVERMMRKAGELHT